MWLCFVSLYNDQCFVWNWWAVDFHFSCMKDQFKTIYHYISIIRCRVSKFPRDKILLRAKRFETRHDFIVSFFLYRLTLSFEDVGSILYFFFFYIYLLRCESFWSSHFFSSLSIHRLIANFFFFFFKKNVSPVFFP